MNDRLSALWVYLSDSQLLYLTLTLAAYVGANRLYIRFGRTPLLNPVLVAVLTLVLLLELTGTPFQTYFDGAQFVHFLLGPATVALAIPLYRQIQAVRRTLPALLTAILVGSASASISAVLIARLAGGSTPTQLALAPKSVTTPVAMGITEQLGGLPSLTAVLVILTGILGAMLGPILLDLLRITDRRTRGVALGTAAHGIATARAMQISEVAGAFAGLAMGINALATAVLLPLLWGYLSEP
jgi:predicted murein hydrolase (TIGR00659 family)